MSSSIVWNGHDRWEPDQQQIKIQESTNPPLQDVKTNRCIYENNDLDNKMIMQYFFPTYVVALTNRNDRLII